VHSPEPLEEEEQDHEAGEEDAPHQHADGGAEQAGALEQDVELLEEFLAAAPLGMVELVHADTGAVDRATEAVGDREQEQADPGDEDRRGNGKLHELGEGLDVEGFHGSDVMNS